MIFIVIVILAVAIIVLLIKYFCSYARLTSHDSFNREAKKRVGGLDYSDPKITCDFCGASIDTRIDKVCPNCGGAFSTDREWENRHNIDQEWIDKSADETANREISAAQMRAAKIAKKLRLLIIILASLLVLTIGLAVCVHIISQGERYLVSEDVNRGSYERYVKKNYAVVGDATIIDTDEIRVSVTGFYYDEEQDRHKIEYTIENLCDEPLRLKLRRLCVNERNNILDSLYLYTWIKKKDTVVTYDIVRYCPEGGIKTLSYFDSYVSFEDYGDMVYEMKEPVELVTDFTAEPSGEIPAGEQVYSQNGITVYNLDRTSEWDTYIRIAIINDTDNDYTVSDVLSRVNGEDIGHHTLYQEELPAHSIMITGSLVSYGSSIKEGDKFDISLSFMCTDNPPADFSTEFIKLN